MDFAESVVSCFVNSFRGKKQKNKKKNKTELLAYDVLIEHSSFCSVGVYIVPHEACPGKHHQMLHFTVEALELSSLSGRKGRRKMIAAFNTKPIEKALPSTKII